MLGLTTLVTASAALTLFSSVSAGPLVEVVKRTGPVSLPSCSSYTPFAYVGCYNESSLPTTTLIFRTNLPSTGMTVEICTAYCKGNLYQYAGLEYYGECFCGGSINGALVDGSNCNLPCDGDKTEACGGSDFVSIYEDPTFPVVDTTTIADYQSMGCYTDLSSTGRTLQWQQTLDTTTMTVETCLFKCKSGGYSFAGLEYGQECWCGVVLGNGTVQVDSSQCAMPCTGNSQETCGDRSLLNLYVATDIDSTEPCNGGSPPSSSSSSSSGSSTTSTSSSSSTTSPPITTTSPTSTKTTTSPTPKLCTSTTTVTPAPTCEYKCGKWCSNPIPDFSDAKGCGVAASYCSVQVASCFLEAGFPESLKCFQFAAWCSNIGTFGKNYCPGGSCSKPNCKSKYPPVGPSTTSSPSISTSVYTCSATSVSTTKTTATTSSTSTGIPVPTASNVCVQPHSPSKGYTSGSPVGGISLPCLTCNNLQSDYNSNPFKLYTDSDTKKCNSYKSDKNSIVKACQDACDKQYYSCIYTYAQSCKTNSGRNGQDNYSQSKNKCQNQQADCYKANSGVSSNGRCGSWNSGW